MKNPLKLFGIVLFASIVIISIFEFYSIKPNSDNFNKFRKLSKSQRLILFNQYDWDRTKDPKTGRVPDGIKEQVLKFASNIESREEWYARQYGTAKIGDYDNGIFEWRNVGPNNVGGRANCVDVDINNEKIILLGAATGGVWRSQDAGISWVKTTAPNDMQGVYSLAQDRRTGKTNIWYYGTGELLTTIDRKLSTAPRMSYPGDGIFKSTDNGASWFQLKSTKTSSTGKLAENFQGVWKIIPDINDTQNDVVYAACVGGILKSTDGGNNWKLILGDDKNKSFSSDLQMGKDGTLYASLSRITLSGDAPKYSGIYQSTNKGTSWQSITPQDFPENTKVIKLALAPTSNSFLMALTDSPNSGYDQYSFQTTKQTLWKCSNIKTGPSWANLSSGMFPPSQEIMSFATLGGYAFVIKIKPDDENTVLIGGTSLYRSKNCFADNSKFDMIGGYYWNDGYFGYDLSGEYLHPDIHDFIFLPSNPDVFYSVSDGGIYRSESISALVPTWKAFNTGLVTSQFYSVAIGKSSLSNNYLIGGLQDNGSFYLENKELSQKWAQVTGGDGMHVALANDMSFSITSWYNGSMVYSLLDPDTFEPKAFFYASPYQAQDTDFNFYNNFILDPNDNNSIYLPAKNKIIYNHSLNSITQNAEEYQNAWILEPADAFVLPENEQITILKISKSIPDAMFIGTNVGKLYMIDNLSNPSMSARYELTGSNFPENAWVSSIDYDEQTGDIMVTFSNYSIQSIFISTDNGDSWTSVGGNLEENPDGTGAGPSVRWAKIVNISPNKTYYFVATDVGVFSTDKPDGDNTVWLQEGKSTIGNVIVEMLDYYNGEIVAATQGAGIFTAKLPNSVKPDGVVTNELMQNFPNPAQSNTNFKFILSKDEIAEIDLFDIKGNKVKNLLKGYLEKGEHQLGFETNNLPAGVYFYSLKTSGGTLTKKMIVKH